jgi:hypothetical protein
LNLGTFGKTRNRKKDAKFHELVMLMIMISGMIPLTIIAMLLVLNIDPFSFILPQFNYPFLNLISFLLRLFPLLLTGYVTWLPYGCVYLVLVVSIKIVSDSSDALLKWTELKLNKNVQFVNIKKLTNKRKKILPKPSDNRRNVTISRILMIKRQCRAVTELINESCYALFPSLLFFGQSVLVLSNYATIKMHDRIPMPFYLVMPFLSVFIVVLISVLFPAASDVHEGSLEFLRSVHLIVGRSKYWRKVWRAERPLRFNVGGLFRAKRSTKTTFFYQCIDFTVTALMLF